MTGEAAVETGGVVEDGAPPASERVREGFVDVPRDWIERVKLHELTLEQLGLAVALASEAVYGEAQTLQVQGLSVTLTRGQAILGDRTFAERYNLPKPKTAGRERVKRPRLTLERLGICECAPAKAVPPPVPGAIQGPLHPPLRWSLDRRARRPRRRQSLPSLHGAYQVTPYRLSDEALEYVEDALESLRVGKLPIGRLHETRSFIADEFGA